MKQALKFLQKNNVNVKEVQKKSQEEPKSFLQTMENGKAIEVHKSVITDLVMNQKEQVRKLKKIKGTLTDPQDIARVEQDKILVKNSVQISTDKKGDNHILVSPIIDAEILSCDDTPRKDEENSDYFDQQRKKSSNTQTQVANFRLTRKSAREKETPSSGSE